MYTQYKDYMFQAHCLCQPITAVVKVLVSRSQAENTVTKFELKVFKCLAWMFPIKQYNLLFENNWFVINFITS